MSRGLNEGASVAGVLRDSKASLKRIAWAYGCAKKDSPTEDALYTLLLDRVLDALGRRKIER